MPQRPWALGEQHRFLSDRLPEYRIVQPTKVYTGFWPRLYEDWFKEYPERNTLFPGKPINEPLTDKEEIQLGSALRVRRGVHLTHL